MSTENSFTEREVFSPSTWTDLDPVAWMFASLGLALLLVIALIVIAKLWTDVKKLRDRLDSNLCGATNGRYNTTEIGDPEKAITVE